MDAAKLKAAEAEAKRFLSRCADYRKAAGESDGAWEHPRESGAVKRASMDLTRALADLRKPRS
jgi:hypothetical protein